MAITLPEAFTRHQAQIRAEREAERRAWDQRVTEHRDLVETVLAGLMPLIEAGVCTEDQVPFRAWVETLDSLESLVLLGFGYPEEEARLIAVVTVTDRLITWVDDLHQQDAFAEDAESLLDVLYLRIAISGTSVLDLVGSADVLALPAATATVQLELELTVEEHLDTGSGQIEEPLETADTELEADIVAVQLHCGVARPWAEINHQLADWYQSGQLGRGLLQAIPISDTVFEVDPADRSLPRKQYILFALRIRDRSPNDGNLLDMVRRGMEAGYLPVEDYQLAGANVVRGNADELQVLFEDMIHRYETRSR
ncbi:hypothetical protein [Thiomonas sp.]